MDTIRPQTRNTRQIFAVRIRDKVLGGKKREMRNVNFGTNIFILKALLQFCGIFYEGTMKRRSLGQYIRSE